MGLFFSKRPPATYIDIPDPRRPSLFFVLGSPEVAVSLLATIFSFFLLCIVARDDHMEGRQGLWQTFNRRSRARMESREAELQREPPIPLSADMVLLVICVMCSNAFVGACASAFANEQRRIEAAEDATWREQMENPATRAAALAAKADILAAQMKVWEENEKRRAEKRPLKRVRIMKVDVMADEVLTNVFVGVALTLACGIIFYVQLQPPNQIRGWGSAAMLSVFAGAMLMSGLDRHLGALRRFCSYVNLICVAVLLLLYLRATMLAQ